ncbi:chaperone of endosialidase [Salmonella phage Kenya-K36]|nr:chaperone of endosialidase [Salmonella phage Kenya-K36]
MALKTKIIVQQILNIDDTTTTASKYPKYTVVLGNSISSITAGELTAAVEAAAGSAAAAKGSEIAAKDSENKAKDSEIQAGIHAGASEASATQSAASATESEKQANLSQSSAENSAASALESKNFKDAAELAAQNAEQSKILAEQAQKAAEAAQSGAQASENRASAFATQAAASSASAGDFAAAAKQSELNAKTSETNAASSATEAGDKAIDATTEADRAKAEADRAAQIVDIKLDKEDISGFIKVYKTKAEADADVANRVLDEKILVWNQTDSKYGWYKVAGTAEALVLELVETEQKLVSVNNVHADDAGNVQITLPGGNPSLWLGEVTWFPYDKDSGVGYPGVLPADGREVLRVDYPDTWEAIEAGLIPSVSEAEWQAGATLYFSTGDGSTTFRLPDMMQGQAFRAAAKGEENAGNIKEQIPYITSVNGVLPEDATGAIVLGLSSVEGTLSIAKGGTGATTKEAARTALEVPAASDVYTKAETYEKSELYTQTEIDDKLADVYTQTEIDDKLADVYTQTEIDDKLVEVKTQADTSYLAKTQNLSDLADRAAAWLNVRPIGSTPLSGDPVNDYDAVTKRWVENKINTGTIGPTMNGVMNYGVGDFHLRDSRAYIQPYEVTSDGQLLNRADWPELWAYAQMLTPITDAEWLADPSKRGNYSLGNGTTTFRVPDRNGVQTGSIDSLYGRGDGGNSSLNGTVIESGAPDIQGTIRTVSTAAVFENSGQSGAFYNQDANYPYANLGGIVAGGSSKNYPRRVNFSASRSNPVYGRTTTEIRPKSFIGVWVIRASGGFVAANTSWSVINGDKTAPSIGTNIRGGEIHSDYNIGGSMHIRSSMRADGNYGQRGGGVWRIEDYQGKSNEIQFNMDTNVIFPVPIVTDGMNVIARSIQGPDGTWPTGSPWVGCQLTGRVANEGFAGAQFNMYVQENVGVDTFGGLLFIGANTTQAWLFNQFGNAIAPGSWVSNSDRRIKKDIARIDDPLDKMRKIHGYSWRKLEGNQFGVGFIAQEVQELFPEAVYEGPSRTMPDGTVVDGVLSPDTSGVAAALHHEAILALMDQIEELKQEIAVLKATMQTLP